MSFITTPLLRVLRLGSRKEKGHCRCLRRPADEEQIQETKHLTELSCYRTAVSSQQSAVSLCIVFDGWLIARSEMSNSTVWDGVVLAPEICSSAANCPDEKGQQAVPALYDVAVQYKHKQLCSPME